MENDGEDRNKEMHNRTSLDLRNPFVLKAFYNRQQQQKFMTALTVTWFRKTKNVQNLLNAPNYGKFLEKIA